MLNGKNIPFPLAVALFLTLFYEMTFLLRTQQSQPIQAHGAFHNAHDFVLNNPRFINTMTDDGFMEKFAGYTIRGAELDSSARDPPPRCHPGTRKGIVDRIHLWFCNPCRSKKMLWLVGPAGVGKSAIMQTVAEVECRTNILAALFFSAPNGRNNPSRVIITLAYQLAARYSPYFHYIRAKIMADPTVLEKSIKGQFVEFIVKPFVENQLYQGINPILIFIDGLDECNGRDEQILFLGLISFFTTKYPEAPLLWIVSSRPEDHITSFLSRKRFTPCFDKEEVSVDSTEACKDVERFLRAEFAKIQSSNSVMSLYPNWPPENLLLELFAAALGHFAYADTAIRFIREGKHLARFQLIIDLIKAPHSHKSGVETTQPMARLDALYQYIISRIAPDDLLHTTEILLHLLFPLPTRSFKGGISFICDWLGMAPDIMYSALRELHSVLNIPPPDKPFKKIKFRHKSFADSLLRMQMSGLPVDRCDAEKMYKSQLVHVLNRIPICHSPTAPEIPSSLYSWTYKNSEELGHAAIIFSYGLADCIVDLGIGSDRPVTTNTIHALKVAAVFSRSPDCQNLSFLTEVFNDSSTLACHLQEDGSLWDVPVGLLDINVIQTNDFLFFFSDGYIDCDYEWERYLCIKSAILNSPGARVKAFIANRLRGWIDVTTILLTNEDRYSRELGILPRRKAIDASRILLKYDFSTIYANVMCGSSAVVDKPAGCEDASTVVGSAEAI